MPESKAPMKLRGLSRDSVSFAILLPILVLLVWLVLVIVPTARFALHLRQVANGSGTGTVFLQLGQFTVHVKRERFLTFSLETVSLSAQRPIIVLNAPASFVGGLVSLIVAQRGNWGPSGMMLGAWRTLMYPIFALPAWFFVGRAVDAFVRRSRLHVWNVWVGSVLALISAALAFGLRFGMTASERQVSEQSDWFAAGFALWTLLFATPLVAWLRSRGRLVRKE